MNSDKCPLCGETRLFDLPHTQFLCGTDLDISGVPIAQGIVCGLNCQLAQAQAEIKDNELRMEEAADQVQSQARTICDLRAEIESKDEALIKANNAYLLLNREMNRYRDNCREMQRGKEQAQAEIERLQAENARPQGEVLAVVDSIVYMQDNAAWLSIIKLPPMPDQPVTVTVRRREEER
jgi:septal ring factor EnvC (AmiA/AmiB activator)